MLVAVQSPISVRTIALPDQANGRHRLIDSQGVELAYLEGRDGKWALIPDEGVDVVGASGDRHPVFLEDDKPAALNLTSKEGQSWSLLFRPTQLTALQSTLYGFVGEKDITVGRGPDNTICYSDPMVSAQHARLSFRDGAWTAYDLQSSNGVFVNGKRVIRGQAQLLSYGDVVSVLGLSVTVGKGLFACNNPGGMVNIDEKGLKRYRSPGVKGREEVRVKEREYFYPALRFPRSIERKSYVIDAPPQPEQEDKTPLLMRVGPSMVMAFTSILSACVFISMMADQNSSMMRAVPMIAMAVSMLVASVLWPVLNRRHQRKERARRESQRRSMYSQYLSRILSEMSAEETLQKEILNENRITVHECLARAQDLDPRLMDRTSMHEDYLCVRMGVGEEAFAADIRFPDQRFSVVEDELRERVDLEARAPRVLENVPVAFPLIEKQISGLVGDSAKTHAFARGLIVQIAALFSYEDVKLVLLCDEGDRGQWEFVSHLPHCFSDDRSARYFACGLEESAQTGMLLERIMESRRATDRFDAREAKPYYVVICASEEIASKSEAVKSLVRERDNLGISLIALSQEMKDLPKECRSVIGLECGECFMLDREDPKGYKKHFEPDIALSVAEVEQFARNMGRVRLSLAIENKSLPDSLGFLEMLGVGKTEHIDIASRWVDSNASATLACRVGVDAQGEPFLLNLHEKFHGPHGLIAGTTGSGKSEFIITLILSLALTYSPNDVAFVLIDYKGGGLAKAFDNDRVRLPHLSGVITNLDGAAITRSLVSIKSELKRRQMLFNRARDAVGGENVDIYRYLDLFRQGRVTEKCPHLFIVADEFAELKQQQPEFMDELISAARIGRSLGIHLILATQKPSGVVNDQIWSNSRFKVCLKVADASDSREMIRRTDAAEIFQAGRFYLLVGYNEYYALGQSGYSGVKYMAKDEFEPSRDDSVVLISNSGAPLVSVKPHVAVSASGKVSELVAVLESVQNTAHELGTFASKLWLEPIPSVVTIEDLERKYLAKGAKEDPWHLEPIVGELDDPDNQRQAAFKLPLSDEGSVLVYGTVESGVELVLHSAIYSLLRHHDAQRLHVYALDFGSESLRAFEKAPHVGDVVGLGEDEKVRRFFDFIEGEFSGRRTILASSGGSFERYAKRNDDLPAMLLVLNDVAALMEAYPQYEERLVRLTREAGRSGIFLLATAANSSAIRMRMRQSFRVQLAIDLADDSDYAAIFGRMRGVPIPRGFGRGLVKTEEGLFEIQAAHLNRDGDNYSFASALCSELAEALELVGVEGARRLPSVPSSVLPHMIAGAKASSTFVPYGLFDDDLEVAGFSFTESPIARCLYQRRKEGSAFLRSLLKTVELRDGWDVVLLDVARTFGEEKPEGCLFATRDVDTAKGYLLTIATAVGRISENKVLVVVTGIVELVNKAGFESASKIKALLKDMTTESGLYLLLADLVADGTYTYEDWYKAHLTVRDGLWVGPGIESQSSINVAYNARFAPDSIMKKSKGYAVDGGLTRLVHMVCWKAEEGNR